LPQFIPKLSTSRLSQIHKNWDFAPPPLLKNCPQETFLLLLKSAPMSAADKTEMFRFFVAFALQLLIVLFMQQRKRKWRFAMEKSARGQSYKCPA
jgi:hypothetical protein